MTDTGLPTAPEKGKEAVVGQGRIQPVSIRLERVSDRAEDTYTLEYHSKAGGGGSSGRRGGRGDPLAWADRVVCGWGKGLRVGEVNGIRYDITYEDGKSCRGRYELRCQAPEGALTAHIRTELHIWSGRERPSYLSDEEYAVLLEANAKRVERSMVWVAGYRFFSRQL